MNVQIPTIIVYIKLGVRWEENTEIFVLINICTYAQPLLFKKARYKRKELWGMNWGKNN